MKSGGSSRLFSGGGGGTSYFAETKCFAAMIWIEQDCRIGTEISEKSEISEKNSFVRKLFSSLFPTYLHYFSSPSILPRYPFLLPSHFSILQGLVFSPFLLVTVCRVKYDNSSKLSKHICTQQNAYNVG